MRPDVNAWIEKAEGDWDTMNREFAVTERPNFDAVCFHAQQCAEKYLKGRLLHVGVSFPKTHDLSSLLEDLLEMESEKDFAELRDDAKVLTSLASEIRYPGMKAIKSDATRAITRYERFRSAFRASFGLS